MYKPAVGRTVAKVTPKRWLLSEIATLRTARPAEQDIVLKKKKLHFSLAILQSAGKNIYSDGKIFAIFLKN